MQYGLGRYSCALKNVQNALRDPHASRSFDILEAIMIMIVMEVRGSLRIYLGRYVLMLSSFSFLTVKMAGYIMLGV